jgi:hypothetical protein
MKDRSEIEEATRDQLRMRQLQDRRFEILFTRILGILTEFRTTDLKVYSLWLCVFTWIREVDLI